MVAIDRCCVISAVTTRFVIEQFAFFDFVFSLDFIFFAGTEIFRLNSCRIVKLWVEVAIGYFSIAATKHQRGYVSLEWVEKRLPPFLSLIAIWVSLVGRRRGKAVGTMIDKSHCRNNKSVSEIISNNSHTKQMEIEQSFVAVTNCAFHDMSPDWN